LTDDLGKEDNRPDERCGSLYRVAPAQNHPFRRWPEWNRLRVVTTADSIRVEMNDQLVVDADRRQLQRQFPEHRGLKRKLGGICLYPIAGKSEYRGMWIRPLR